MPSPKELFDDPDFMGLPDGEKIKVISAVDPDFGGLPPEEQTRVFQMLGGGGGSGTSSIDTPLSTQRGQGPTVDSEGGPKDETTPSNVPPDGTNPLWALAAPGGAGALAGMFGGPEGRANLGLGQAKGLGQAGYNLWKVGAQSDPRLAGLAPPPMPSWLQTGESGAEEAGAFLGRISPGIAASAVMPQNIPMQALAGGISGAGERGTPFGAALGAGAGAAAQAAPAALGVLGSAWQGAKQVPGVGRVVKGLSGLASPRIRHGIETFEGVKEMLGLGSKTPKAPPDLARAAQMAKEAEAADSAFNAAKIADRQRGVKIADEKARQIAEQRISAYRRADEKTRLMASAAIARKKAEAAARKAGELRAADYEADVLAAKEGVAPSPVVDAVKDAANEAKATLAAKKAAEAHAEALEAELAASLAEARELAALQGPAPLTRAAGSGTAPGPAFPPPPGMGASGLPPRPPMPPPSPVSGSGGTPIAPPPMAEGLQPPPSFQPSIPTGSQTGGAIIVPKGKTKPGTIGGGKRADLPPKSMEKTGNVIRPKDEVPLDKAVKELERPSLTPKERADLLRKLSGKTREEKGAALSDATNKPLDPEDASEAADFLKQAGSLEEALRLIREHPDNTVQEVYRLSRAVREASRRAK